MSVPVAADPSGFIHSEIFMALGKWFLCAALTLTSGSLLIAADAPATQPAEGKAVHTRKLTEPWVLLKTLTPEQTSQIEKIHADSLEERKKIDAKEHDDIMAILTPDQKTELKEAMAKQKAERSEKTGHKKAATTEPAK
jgi:Spy/CpxP family protein refolding chaperone